MIKVNGSYVSVSAQFKLSGAYSAVTQYIKNGGTWADSSDVVYISASITLDKKNANTFFVYGGTEDITITIPSGIVGTSLDISVYQAGTGRISVIHA